MSELHLPIPSELALIRQTGVSISGSPIPFSRCSSLSSAPSRMENPDEIIKAQLRTYLFYLNEQIHTVEKQIKSFKHQIHNEQNKERRWALEDITTETRCACEKLQSRRGQILSIIESL